MGKSGILLVNLGTPDSPETKDVRKYLREFLMDEHVIDIAGWKRWILVNLIIAPLRAPKSAAEYRKLWTDEGSPLLFHGLKLQADLQKQLGDDFHVAFGMRYQNPPVEKAIDELVAANVDDILVVPLYPQFAMASTGSTIENVKHFVEAKGIKTPVKFIESFPEHPGFIDAFAELGKKYLEQENYDHVLYSYHGLPERQILKGSIDGHCKLNAECCSELTEKNHLCYRAQCFATSRKLTEALGLKEDQQSTSFQSRLGRDPWIKPYTDDVLAKFPEQGKKKVLCFSPAFVADCLETTVEIAETYGEEFEEAGGEKWQLVESLNTTSRWIEALADLVKSNPVKAN